MPEYLSPGVYVEEVERGPRPIEGVSTSTAGFLGQTERGPTDPELVTSFTDFERRFGGFTLYKQGEKLESTHLAYGIEGFFRNGGMRCYIGRIAPEDAGTASVTLLDNTDVLTANAIGPGTWGNNVAVVVEDASLDREGKNALFKVTLRYWAEDEAAATAKEHDADTGEEDVSEPDVEEVYDNLSPREESSNYYKSQINGVSNLVEVEPENVGRPSTDEVVWLDTGNTDSTGSNSDNDDSGNGDNGNSNGDNEEDENDDSTGWNSEDSGSNSDDSDNGDSNNDNEEDEPNPIGDGGQPSVTLSDYRGDPAAPPGKRTGLAAFEKIDDISIVCVPDEKSIDGLTAEIVDHCENMGDRFAVLHAAQNAGTVSDLIPRIDSTRLDSTYAAFYYPWITVMDPGTNDPKIVPPGGHVTGIYARNDTERGVHKAPANEVVRGAQELQFKISKQEQETLNPRGVNCIRSLRGRGIRVWGARTTSSNPLWKYVNVRRLFLYLENSIEEATQWVVFEPNDERLWARVRQTVSNFLTTQWENGALMGTTREEAFFVKCDRSTMTQNDIDNGRLIVEIGVAPVKPAEFVVFRITQWTSGAEEA